MQWALGISQTSHLERGVNRRNYFRQFDQIKLSPLLHDLSKWVSQFGLPKSHSEFNLLNSYKTTFSAFSPLSFTRPATSGASVAQSVIALA